MTLILLFTCIETPISIAFLGKEEGLNLDTIAIVEYVVDFFFLIDIFVIFNSAYY